MHKRGCILIFAMIFLLFMQSGCFMKAYHAEGFKAFSQNLKEKHSYIKKMELDIAKSHDLALSITHEGSGELGGNQNIVCLRTLSHM